MKEINIPIFRPSCSPTEIEGVTRVLESGWWGLGPKTAEFEKRFAELIGVKYAVGVTSCTVALDLAIKAHDIKDGEVIVPALTFVSTALAPLYNNNKIVFADIDEETLCIDWEDVQAKITPKTKAVIPVWYAGRYIKPPILPEGITIIEDAAHACGTKDAGTEHTACWSFHAVKNLATGDGGMITTNNPEIYKKLLALRWCGIDKTTWERTQKKYGWDYSIEEVGYKAHMNDITAALGLAQLGRLDQLNANRKLRVLEYKEGLKGLDWIKLPNYDPAMSWHLLAARVKDRDRFIDYLLAHGISAGVHYKPLNTYNIFPHTELPITDKVWLELVTLPLFPDLSDEEMNYILTTIRRFE